MSSENQRRRLAAAHAVRSLTIPTLLAACLVAPPAASAQRAGESAGCATALAFERAGRVELAEEAFRAAFSEKGPPPCAEEGLKRVTERRGECDHGKVLEHLERHEEAQAAYLRELARDPASPCAASGLASLPGKSPLEHAEEATTLLANGLVLLAAVLVLGSAVALLLLAGLGKSHRIRSFLSRVPLVGRLLSPRVRIEDFDDGAVEPSMGNGLSALVRGRVNVRIAGVTQEVHQIMGESDVKVALEGLKDLSPQVGVGVALLLALQRLLPRKLFTVNAVLQPAGTRGPGLTVTLRVGRSAAAVESFWASPLGYYTPSPTASTPAVSEAEADASRATAAYYSLSRPATAWINHRIARTLGAGGTITRDSNSYALFRVGLDWQQRGDRIMARRLYDAALSADPDNVAARANLGAIDAGDGLYDASIYHFERALQALRSQSS